MSKVAVKKQVIGWALARAGLSYVDIEGKFPKIKQWIEGDIQPTLKQLEQLAKTTRTPLGFFFLNEPPEEKLPVPLFRTIDDEEHSNQPSPELIETIQIMKQRQIWMRDYLIDIGQEPLPFIRSINPNENVDTIAGTIRNILQLEDNWASQLPTWEEALRTLRSAMEKAGILVVFNGIVGNNTRRKLDPHEFRGFVLIDEYAPLVFVNNKDVKAANIFTLAHELAHVFFGSSAVFDLRATLPADDPGEQLCNKVAAEFLVPERELRVFWPSASNLSEPFDAVARNFKVSTLVAARRALDLGIIQKQDFLKFYRNYKKDERRVSEQRKSGGDFYINQDMRIGKKFAKAVFQATKEGKLSFYDAYKLTGLYGKTFDNYSASLQSRGLLDG